MVYKLNKTRTNYVLTDNVLCVKNRNSESLKVIVRSGPGRRFTHCNQQLQLRHHRPNDDFLINANVCILMKSYCFVQIMF